MAGALQPTKPGGYLVQGEVCFFLHPLSLCLPWPTGHKRRSVTSLSAATLHPHQPLYTCCCSITQSCPALCNPMDCSMPGFPVLHHLPEFTQARVHRFGDAIQPSHPLLSPSPPTFNLSQHQGLFQWVSSSYQLAKGLELQLQHQSFQWIFQVISFRSDPYRSLDSPKYVSSHNVPSWKPQNSISCVLSLHRLITICLNGIETPQSRLPWG